MRLLNHVRAGALIVNRGWHKVPKRGHGACDKYDIPPENELHS